MSRRMWKIVETKVGEVRVVETERKGDKRGSRKKMRRKGKGEKTKKLEERNNDKCKESS